MMPPYVIVSAPPGRVVGPDNLVLEPCWTAEEVDAKWEAHPGFQIVAVYRFDGQMYFRDSVWGALGDARLAGRMAPAFGRREAA